jgi:Cytochrome c
MIALTQAQGVVLVIGGGIFVLVAGSVLVLRGRRKPEAPDIPIAMRPGPSDPDLETPLLTKLQGWGLLLVVFFVIWIPVTWLFEPGTNLDQEKALLTDSIARGESDVQLFSEVNQGGIGCTRCHGPNLEGSKILNTATNAVVPTPDLRTVCGGPWTGHSLIYSLNDIYITIQQGRGDMPSWSIRFAGALDDQQINDIVNYIVSIQDKSAVPAAHNICTNPDATTAAVKQFGPPAAPPTSNGAP